MVPKHAAVRSIHGVKCTEIKYSYNLHKTLITIAQILYALTSLYHTRIHQIARFGYAAFGLTVAPYAVMSLMNLISCVFSPDFKGIYMTSSGVMEEARARGGVFEEIVGELVDERSGILKVPETTSHGFIKQRVTRLIFAQNEAGQITAEHFDAGQVPKVKVQERETAPAQTGQSLEEISAEVQRAIATETAANTIETATTNSTSKYRIVYDEADELEATGNPITTMFWFPTPATPSNPVNTHSRSSSAPRSRTQLHKP
jgi:hypothetical protein